MSGGYWDYAGFKIEEIIDEIANDGQTQKRFPELASVLIQLGAALYSIESTLDWDFSCDALIEDDRAYEREAIQLLALAL
jgi:hypothetical protein